MALPMCKECKVIMRVGVGKDFTQIIICPRCGKYQVVDTRKKEQK
jgi:hypothetical protein